MLIVRALAMKYIVSRDISADDASGASGNRMGPCERENERERRCALARTWAGRSPDPPEPPGAGTTCGASTRLGEDRKETAMTSSAQVETMGRSSPAADLHNPSYQA